MQTVLVCKKLKGYQHLLHYLCKRPLLVSVINCTPSLAYDFIPLFLFRMQIIYSSTSITECSKCNKLCAFDIALEIKRFLLLSLVALEGIKSSLASILNIYGLYFVLLSNHCHNHHANPSSFSLHRR